MAVTRIGASGGRSIWVTDLPRKSLSPVTFGRDDTSPAWSPRGRCLAFLRRLVEDVAYQLGVQDYARQRKFRERVRECLELALSLNRDLTAAKGFLHLALSAVAVVPRVVNVDGRPAYASAISEFEAAGELSPTCRCRPSPYLSLSVFLSGKTR